VQKYRRDDVRAAWEIGHFATEEMNDEIFIRREEMETRR
jgi:hypothetical protein